MEEREDPGDYSRGSKKMSSKADEDTRIKGYLFNLIVYSHEKMRSEHFQKIVRTFIEKFPCRVIFIESYQDGENKQLEMKFLPSKEGEILCDKIKISVSKSELFQVPFILLTKLVPDLPIYLVWGQNPTSDNEILPQLEKLATRFVFDAECASNLQEFSLKMLGKIDELKTDFMDVSWAKISGWRDVISETFKTHEKLEYLRKCTRLLIKYNRMPLQDHQHSAIQAIFLQGWLAAQLGWHFNGVTCDGEIKITYKRSLGEVEVILRPQERATLELGRVFELEFQDVSELKTTFTLAEKQSKVMVYVSNPEKCELPFSHPIPDMSKSSTAMKEVFYYRASSHYRKMLSVIKDIPWKDF